MRRFAVKTFSQAKRLIVAVTGFTVLAIGIAMIVLPGPAVIVIPIGLGILATEFIWARKLLASVMQRIEQIKSRNSRKLNSD